MTSPESFSEQEQQFLKEFQQSLDLNHFERLILSQYQGKLEGLQKITFRLVELQNQVKLSGLYHYQTQDVTKNYTLEEAVLHIISLLHVCKQANLLNASHELQLKKNKKKVMLTRTKRKDITSKDTPLITHNRKSSVMLHKIAYF